MREFFISSSFAGVVLSLVFYEIGAFLKSKFKIGLFNPLLVSLVLTIGFLLITGVDYEIYNDGAKYLSWFLTPCLLYTSPSPRDTKLSRMPSSA